MKLAPAHPNERRYDILPEPAKAAWLNIKTSGLGRFRWEKVDHE